MTAANWNKPDLNSTKAQWLDEARLLSTHAAQMDFTSDTNIPTGAVRFNTGVYAFETYDGANWNRAFPAAGSIEPMLRASAPSGYLPLDGRTIGDGSSGASTASASMLDLFTALWNDLANAQAPVSTGRGASAAADFAAHKTLTIPDARQKFLIAKATSGTGSTIGGTGGTIDHLHDMSNHTHGSGTLRADVGSNPGTNEHIFMALDGGSTFSSSYKYSVAGSVLASNSTTTASCTTHGSTAVPSTNNTGTANPPFLAVNYMIKI